MNNIQNSCLRASTPFSRVIAGLGVVLAVSAIALSIIGLTATSGPFNVIVQLGTRINGVILGASIFVLILDLAWIAILSKKREEPSVSQSEPNQNPSLPLDENIPIDDSNVEKFDPVTILPEEIIQVEIFSRLGPISLGRCGQVSKGWRKQATNSTLWNAFDLREISPSLKVYDKSNWSNDVDLVQYELVVEDEPPLGQREAIPLLISSISSLEIEEDAGATLLTIPQGLTIRKAIALGQTPKVGNIAKFRYFSDSVLNDLGDIPVDKTYRILITNNVLKKSRNLSANDQKALVEGSGCEMPRILEAIVLLVVTFMETGKRLYADKPWTYTRCFEQVTGYQAVVGGFSPVGIDVCNDCDYGYLGVGGVLRKF